jgi:plasmid stabilization system protein ParE
LKQIGKYIAQHDPIAATQFVSKLVYETRSLSQLPLQGQEVLGEPGVRRISYGNYLIYYKVQKGRPVVRVLRFWHGARNQTPRLQ